MKVEQIIGRFEIDEEINEFIIDNPGINIIDIKFSTSTQLYSTVNGDRTIETVSSALIMYEENK